MKKKLLILLITAVSVMAPNLVAAIAVDVGDCGDFVPFDSSFLR